MKIKKIGSVLLAIAALFLALAAYFLYGRYRMQQMSSCIADNETNVIAVEPEDTLEVLADLEPEPKPEPKAEVKPEPEVKAEPKQEEKPAATEQKSIFTLKSEKKMAPNFNVVGKIDLDSLNQSTRPKKKSKEERRKEREEKQAQMHGEKKKRERIHGGKERVDIEASRLQPVRTTVMAATRTTIRRTRVATRTSRMETTVAARRTRRTAPSRSLWRLTTRQ